MPTLTSLFRLVQHLDQLPPRLQAKPQALQGRLALPTHRDLPRERVDCSPFVSLFSSVHLHLKLCSEHTFGMKLFFCLWIPHIQVPPSPGHTQELSPDCISCLEGSPESRMLRCGGNGKQKRKVRLMPDNICSVSDSTRISPCRGHITF